MQRFHLCSIPSGVNLVVAIMLGVLTGCVRTGDPGPLDNESLGLLVASRKDRPCLGKPAEHLLFDITDQQTNSFINALRPITSVKVGQLAPDAVDYTLYFQPGMDPLAFYVDLADDHLVYSERQYLYEGGDAKAFQQIADTIMTSRPRKSGEIVDGEFQGGVRGQSLNSE